MSKLKLRMENPFIVTGKIPEEYFCDRENESARLISLITNGHNVLLISPRRMGKTGLIYHCFDFPEIRKDYISIFVDILQTTSLQEFAFLLGKAVFDALLTGSRRLLRKFVDTLKSLQGKFSYDALTGAPSFTLQLGDITTPDYTLDEIFAFIKQADKPCLIAIDEFQQITHYPEKNVEAMLRTYIQQCSGCNFIYSGSREHLIAEMFLYPNRPFYNSTSILNLEPIPCRVYIDFVKRQFNKFNKDIREEAIEYLYNRFAGTTFYMQSVLNQAFYSTAEGAICAVHSIEDSITNCVDSAAGLYREILSGLTIRQKELLVAIAKEEPAQNITSAAFIRRNGLKSASSVQGAQKKLSEFNLISKIDNSFTLTDKFLSIWLRNTY